jgi:anti-sigma factor RsiW
MITCRELVEFLHDFVANELAPPRRDDVEQHLRGCLPCHAYCESYRITIVLARRLPCPPPPPDALDRLRRGFECCLKEAHGTGA